MKKRFLSVVLISLLIACGGIPLSSVPRLMKLQSELLRANPVDFMLAIQVDSRMVPPADASPVLHLSIRPSEASAFQPMDKKLPMSFQILAVDTLQLPKPTGSRRWLVYSLAPESQVELRRIQNNFKRLQAQHPSGVIVSVGITQDGVAAKVPALASTRWESWLQTSRQEGFFELWSGSIAELQKRAKDSAAASAHKMN